MADKLIRDTSGRMRKQLTVHLTKRLMKEADTLVKNIIPDIEEKLLQTTKDNLRASYEPRSIPGKAIVEYNKEVKAENKKFNENPNNIGTLSRHTRKLLYHHTGTLEGALYTEVVGDTIQLRAKKTKFYSDDDDARNASEVYDFLVEGTKGSMPLKSYHHTVKGKQVGGINYPTPKHDFEVHTIEQMKGYLHSLEADIKNGKYRRKGSSR
jgi:hypothetical protein